MLPRSHSLLASRQVSATLVLLTLILSLSACTKRARDQRLTTQTKANDQQPPTSPQTTAAPGQQSPQRININTASRKELEKLPGIGKGLAARIVEHREKYGPFRRPEHLIIVRGISDRRFRAMQDLITVR